MLMDSVYTILERAADPTRFPKVVMKKVGLPENHERMWLHAFMSSVHSTFCAEYALKFSANLTH